MGTFADGIHGVNVLFKGGEVSARGFGVAVVGALDFAQNQMPSFSQALKRQVLKPLQFGLILASAFSDDALDALKSVTEQAESIKPGSGLGEIFNEMSAGLNQAKVDLNNLILEEIPSEVIGGKLDRVLTAAHVRAEAIAAKVNADMQLGQDGGSVDDAITQAEKDKIQGRLDWLSQSYLTEFELLEHKYLNEQQLLEEAEGAKLITEDEFNERSKKATKKFEKEKTDLEKTRKILR